jgi:hypothetical protein
MSSSSYWSISFYQLISTISILMLSTHLCLVLPTCLSFSHNLSLQDPFLCYLPTYVLVFLLVYLPLISYLYKIHLNVIYPPMSWSSYWPISLSHPISTTSIVMLSIHLCLGLGASIKTSALDNILVRTHYLWILPYTVVIASLNSYSKRHKLIIWWVVWRIIRRLERLTEPYDYYETSWQIEGQTWG